MFSNHKKYIMKLLKNSIVISLILLFSYSLNAQQQKEYTNYIITFGASVNANWHTSEFNNLPGAPATLTTFTNAFGLGWSAYIGGEYELEEKFLFGKVRPYAQLSYSNLSATFEDDEDIGHVIKPDGSYSMGVSRHTLKSKHTVLGIEAGLVYYVPGLKDFAVKLGFIGGMLGNKTYDSKENLISPDGAYYDLDKSTERHAANGDIEKATSSYIGMNVGARYDIYKTDNLTIAPEFNFTIGLSGLNQEIDWSANALKFGVNLQYRIPEAKLPPPMPAPMPNMPKAPMPPPPPAKKDLTIAMMLSQNGTTLANGQSVPVKVNQIINRSSFSVLPVFFFEQNKYTNEGISSPKRYFLNEFTAQQNNFIRLAEFLQDSSNVDIELHARQLNNEETGLAEKRANNIADKLKSFSVADSRISIKSSVFQGDSFKYPELASENRAVWVKLSDGKDLIHFYTDTTTVEAVEVIEFKIEPIVKADTTVLDFKCEVMLNGKKNSDTNVYPFFYKIQDNTLKSTDQKSSVTFIGTVSDELGQKASDEITVNLTPDIRVERTNDNLIEPMNSDKKIRKYILGFFRFDGAEFYAVNEEALREARQAIKDGKTIEITPLTDNLGAEYHNVNLANKRAKAAINLIGKKSGKKIKINETTSEMFSNKTPEGRILNRSILLIINE
jgi:outer membrane protein OmpA-like peptidoglycan-associated protein